MGHSWGDSWPHWDDLYKAQSYFIKLFERTAKKYPHTKEKWGTIRFEATYRWIETLEDVRLFKECIRRTIKKYPQVAGEIASNAGHVLDDEYFEGWCNGVLSLARGSYWSSTKRPNGV